MRPLIGITLDWQKEGTFSKRPHYALRTHYFNIVHKAGGLPFAIPFLPDAIDEYLDKIDGLLVPGGDFGLKPSWYVNNEKQAYAATPRLEFDIKIMDHALQRNLPVLGICAGMQIMGCSHGCKMTSNIVSFLKTDVNHLQTHPIEEYAHNILVESGTLLHKITKTKEFDVNTGHVEAIVETPDNVIVSGKSGDGVIEAIELPDYKFALGVQWHPEFMDNDNDPNFLIFREFIKASGK